MSTTKKGYLITESFQEAYSVIREAIDNLTEYFPEVESQIMADTTRNQSDINWLIVTLATSIGLSDISHKPRKKPRHLVPGPSRDRNRDWDDKKPIYGIDHDMSEEQLQMLLEEDYLEEHLSITLRFIQQSKEYGLRLAICKLLEREEQDSLIDENGTSDYTHENGQFTLEELRVLSWAISEYENLNQLSELESSIESMEHPNLR